MAVILLVDDNPDILSSYSMWLRDEEGFAVVTASHGAQGLEALTQHRPDCVIIDVMMPELDGYQLVCALRGDPATSTVPLIILTALTQDKDRLIGLYSGVDAFISKPIKPDALAEAIREVLRLSDEERAERWKRLAES